QRAYMVLLSAAIYGSDIATGEDAKGLSEAVGNIEKELAVEGGNHQEEEEDRMSIEIPRRSTEIPRRSTDSASSRLKRRKTYKKGKDHVSATSSDLVLDMLHEVQGDLEGVATNMGKMAAVMEREVAVQEKNSKEDHEQKLREKATAELRKLGFTGSEQVKAANVFVRILDQMSMLLTLDETLRREFILNMLSGM
uniref:MLLE-like domain-containing protein n=1 Tax=Setaria italica TaxID=4555 RepID=K3YD65_SETIT